MFEEWLTTPVTQNMLRRLYADLNYPIQTLTLIDDKTLPFMCKILESAYDAGVADENEFWQSHGYHTT